MAPNGYRNAKARIQYETEQATMTSQHPVQGTLRVAPKTGGGFINPYNFVRIPPFPPQRYAQRSHESFTALSGWIECELETLTPLCVPDADASEEFDIERGPNRGKKRWSKPFSRLPDGTLFLSGSTIKGMLRSIAEAASNSCLSILTKDLGVFRDNRSHIPTERGVGRLSRTPAGTLRLDDPCPGRQPDPRMFGKCGLFNQSTRFHHRAPKIKPPRAGLEIPASVQALYEQMIDDRNFTLKIGDKTERPNKRQREWLLDFDNQSGHGNLWFYHCHSARPNLVMTFGRNFRYKWAYDPRMAISPDYHPCHDPADLCPGCALFGMVADRADNVDEPEGRVDALAGKVEVGPGRWCGGTQSMFWIDDPKILGAPKYSCRSFYLTPDTPSLDVERAEYTSLVDGDLVPNPIRGRKFYWHHTRVCDTCWSPADWQIYLSRREKDNQEKPPETHQNARIEAIMSGARFAFTIEFHNLSKVELGLLLWILALPDVPNGAHRLGLGKPLGLGSIALRIRGLKLLDRNQRYRSLFATGIMTNVAIHKDDPVPVAGIDLSTDFFTEFLEAFRSNMERCCSNTPFLELPNITDLRVIMSRDQPNHATLPGHLIQGSGQNEAVPICYPLGPTVSTKRNDPHPEELHYNWFGTKGKRWSERLLSIAEIAQGYRQTLAQNSD